MARQKNLQNTDCMVCNQNTQILKNSTNNQYLKTKRMQLYDKKSIALLIAKYLGYFVAMFLLSLAKSSFGIAPFSLGFFVGLVYCRESVFALAISYILSNIIVGFSVQKLIVVFVPAVVFIVAKMLHAFFLRPMKMLQTNLYAFFSQLPVILFNISSTHKIFHSICCVVIAQIFTYVATTALYAVIVRGAKYKLAKDELFGVCAILIAISIGLFQLKIFKFSPFFMIASFVLMMLVYSKNIPSSFVVAISMGVGAGLGAGNLLVVGGLVIPLAMALIFCKNNIYLSVCAYAIGDIFVGAYFNAFGGYDYFHLIAVLVGLILFLIIPNKVKDHFIHIFGGGQSKTAEHAVVLRNRAETSKKLFDMSKVFSEISGVLGGTEYTLPANNAQDLARYIAIEHCASCPNYKFCSAMLGGDTTPAIKDLIDKAIYNGKLSKDDLSPFLQGRCTRQDSLVATVADKSQKLIRQKEYANQISAGRIILGEQMASLSALLQVLGEDIRGSVFFDTESEQNIITELYYKNIVARDIVVCGENGLFGVDITVRRKDSNKSALPQVVSKVLKSNFEVVEKCQSSLSGFDIVRLKQSPKFSIAYGVATKTMDGSQASGDTFSISKLAFDKTMLVLCDGMGSGKDANINSQSTISMIENFYRAGFKNNAILSLINKILATYNSESFTCLDMAMVDLTNGVIDVIKLGGVQSLIIRQNKWIALGDGALPLGIVEEAKPYTDRHIIMDGDIMVMCTDGVSDYLSKDTICDMIINNSKSNPEQLADDILSLATKGGVKDDSTVIVSRIFAKN